MSHVEAKGIQCEPKFWVITSQGAARVEMRCNRGKHVYSERRQGEGHGVSRTKCYRRDAKRNDSPKRTCAVATSSADV